MPSGDRFYIIFTQLRHILFLINLSDFEMTYRVKPKVNGLESK